MFRPLLLSLAVVAATRPALADTAPPDVATYAVVVGSNAGGPGQTDLRYAEDDARRMGAFLAELGGYSADKIDVIVHPTPDLLRERLTQLGTKVHADLAAGKKARVLFYYSGHARATALDLGNAQMPLAELRTRLFSVPAQLTVVVLDACQSGAFSRVKGATPAADFSFNSRNQLDATGIAVLASSSGSELSQESEQLRSSYFTHHLLVGMRGAGDANKDGQVSIDEAYRYAYHQTLLATAETAVGGQHVSLEVDLKGHGEVPMSFPRAATSSIELPAALEGKTLVQDRRAKAVVAETYKAKGAAVRIAVAPGEYEVLVRQSSTLSRCQVTAGRGGTTLDMERCSSEDIVVATRKGGGFWRPMRIEVSASVGSEHRDAYTETLENFGYEDEFLGASSGLGLSITRQVDRRFWVGLAASHNTSPKWKRFDRYGDLEIDWTLSSIMAVARGVQHFREHGRGSKFGVYAQAAAGLGMGRTHYVDVDGSGTNESHFGPSFAGSAGLEFGNSNVPGRWGRGITFSLGYELVYAPVIQNEVGDTHVSGGHRLTSAFSFSY
ncbi:MAG: caspase family protein [Deltaproteobacteria bacterium]|nr:caspase family protein [Deltaproteobacteria bacterium]